MRKIPLTITSLIIIFSVLSGCKKDKSKCDPSLVVKHLNEQGELLHEFFYDHQKKLVSDSATPVNYQPPIPYPGNHYLYSDTVVKQFGTRSDKIKFNADGTFNSLFRHDGNFPPFEGKRVAIYSNGKLVSLTDTSEISSLSWTSRIYNITYDGAGNIISAVYESRNRDAFAQQYSNIFDSITYFYDYNKVYNDRHFPSVKFNTDLWSGYGSTPDFLYFPQLFSKNTLIRLEHTASGNAIEFISYDYNTRGDVIALRDSVVSSNFPTHIFLEYSAIYDCE
ncbi:MAG: hypothetical protein V4615_02950 [Bacteroidota bacterium]